VLKGSGDGGKVQKEVEGNFGVISFVWSDEGDNETVGQNQNQKEAEEGNGSLKQKAPKVVRFGGKFWCLAEDEESHEEDSI
jgi:hypothetical protein